MTSSGSNTTRDMQCLFIPDDSTPERPIQEMSIHFPPERSFGDVVCEVLQCERECPEILVTDEHLAVFNGHDNGLPLNQQFVAYEAYMDDVGNYTRAKNTRAARLFNRPNGPMLAVKTICTKPEEFAIQALHYERLTENELESAPFQAKRREYLEKKPAHDRSIIEMFFS